MALRLATTRLTRQKNKQWREPLVPLKNPTMSSMTMQMSGRG